MFMEYTKNQLESVVAARPKYFLKVSLISGDLCMYTPLRIYFQFMLNNAKLLNIFMEVGESKILRNVVML